MAVVTTTIAGHAVKLKTENAPVGFDYAGQVWIDDRFMGLTYGETGLEKATAQQKLDALLADIEWDIKTFANLYQRSTN